jgi:hypothetical protein
MIHVLSSLPIIDNILHGYFLDYPWWTKVYFATFPGRSLVSLAAARACRQTNLFYTLALRATPIVM